MNAHHERRILGVIPARLGSERLPRKPLHLLDGRPMIEWVWRRVSGFELFEHVVVATDSEEIVQLCEAIGAPAELTSPDHESGSDRVAEVAARPTFAGFDVIVNVQGDEPFVREDAVRESARLVLDGWDVGTAAAPVRDLEAWRDPAVVKVVRSDDGGAMYFSRSPIPFRRAGEPSPDELSGPGYLRHIGVYAYSPEALERWVRLPSSWLERTERLEQLRALAAGLRIGVGLVEEDAGGVDTIEDAARADARLRAMREAMAEPGTAETDA